MKAYVFPGQGSQYKGMGKALFETFKELTEQADGILGYSIKELCIEDPLSRLGHTQFTQPALFVVNALSYLKKMQESPQPDFVAGHSLGEYNALFAAGAFDFEVGLRLVQKRGELMSLMNEGGMAAVIGLSKDQLANVLETHQLQSVDIANHNTHEQIVISGPKKDIERSKPIFEKIQGVKLFLPLNVSGPFHSRYMSQAKEAFEEYLNMFHFHPLSIPVISNVYALPYQQERLKATLSAQISSSVKWADSIHFLMRQGDVDFEEVGPGSVLTGLIQKIKHNLAVLSPA